MAWTCAALGHAKYKAAFRGDNVTHYLSGFTVEKVHSARRKLRHVTLEDQMKGLCGVIAMHLVLRGALLEDWVESDTITFNLSIISNDMS